METEYTRLEMLIGKEALETLHKKRVLIFGLGGVGGHVTDALARSGIMNFTIVDSDVVSISNINRQLIANHDTLGKAKVDVMEEHLHSINKDIKVDKRNCFYLPEESSEFDFASYDYVIDAIDTVTAKIDIIIKCTELGVPVISALGCGNKLDPTKLEVTDIFKTSYDPLAKVIRYELRKRGVKHLKVVYSKEESTRVDKENKNTPASSAFVPSTAGIIIASVVIRDLLK